MEEKKMRGNSVCMLYWITIKNIQGILGILIPYIFIVAQIGGKVKSIYIFFGVLPDYA